MMMMMKFARVPLINPLRRNEMLLTVRSLSRLSFSSSHPPSTRLHNEVSEKVKTTYAYTASSLALTGLSGCVFYHLGFGEYLAMSSPFASFAIQMMTITPLLVGTIVTDMNQKPILKKALWTGFNAAMGASCCLAGYFGGPLITEAAMITGTMMCGLSAVAFKSNPYELAKYEGPLRTGLTGLVFVGFLGLLSPNPIFQNISLYGGLVVFSGLTITDTRRLITNAEEKGQNYDPINESLSIYLNAINLFVRVLSILSKRRD